MITARRDILRLAAVSPLIFLAGCFRLRRPGRISDLSGARPLIDAHCHLFNVTDLPVSSFAAAVFLKSPSNVPLRLALRRIERLLSRGVPTAAEEAGLNIAFTGSPALPISQALDPKDERSLEEEEKKAERALLSLPAVAKTVTCEQGSGPPKLAIRTIVRWARSLRSRRAWLATELANAHSRSGYSPKLLCPALVDYSNWLDQKLTSPLPDQIDALAAVARDPELPAVHGYVPYDPLRRALIRTQRKPIDGDWDPLAEARRALKVQGFLGVKLYPPMGFRASGNEASGQPYSPAVVARFGMASMLGRELDTSLSELWKICEELDAPILAHGANSNDPVNGYGRRADPVFWFPVLRAHPRLRVMLGHFGRFGTLTDGTTCIAVGKWPPLEATWEGAIAKFVSSNPTANLYADISYLSEVYAKGPRDRAVEGFKWVLAQYPSMIDHLVYGSDWVMLGIDRNYSEKPGYTANVALFLNECGVTALDIDKIMFGNAIRFLGLSKDSVARRRLLDFYGANSALAERLPLA